jgi:penicillin amidase
VVVPGLEHSVRVRWDAFAIPHVFAAVEKDLFFAQGFLHAQERLWQMELSRRFLSGRTAEIFGDLPLPWQDLSVQFRRRTAADLDFFIRLLGIPAAARASLTTLADDLRAKLDAYCAGINGYIERCGKKLPWEFRLLRHKPEPWRAEDPLTIGKGLALLLSTALYSRLNFMGVAGRLAMQPDKLQALLPGDPAEAPAIAKAVFDQAEAVWRFANGFLFQGEWHPGGNGSNAWAVAASRSRTGAPILCNDPHLRMSLPSLWYLMHLRSDEPAARNLEVWGASIPGCPLIQVGRNRDIAWGITAAVCDDVEIYRERLHRIDPERYLSGREWRLFETSEELIRVRRGAPLRRQVRRTRHGPVISDFAQTSNDAEEVLSVRWTAHEPGEELRSLYGVNHASDWPQFLESLSHHGAPSLNFVYADCAGNIGYALAGRIPQRAEAPTLQPLPGWDEEHEWRGYIPFDHLPRIFNPPEGWIASANNRIADAAYPFYLSHFFEPPYRCRRIAQLVAARDKHTVADMAAMQLDDLSLHACALIATLRADLENTAAADPALAQAARALLEWNGRCSSESNAAAIFHVFHHRLLVNLLADDLGEELLTGYLEILNQCIAPTDRILGDAESPWFARRSRPNLVRIALLEACAELAEAFGADVASWRWGRFHTLTLRHSLSRVPLLAGLLSIGPFPAPGDGMTLNLGFYRHSHPFQQTVGASLRFVAEMADQEHAEFVLPSGQSGHPWSAHYSDQNRLWKEGRRLILRGGNRPSGGEELVLQPP